MNRRELITLIGGAAAWPLAARAQQPTKVPRVGILTPAVSISASLGETSTPLPGLAAELVRTPVDVIVTDSTSGTLAAFGATRTIPIERDRHALPLI